VQIDLRTILNESGKITGQIRANLGANPSKIAEAITQAHLFGASLEDINQAGKEMLDFESSISNELQAELLLGKDINLERARAAALNGDQVTLAKELQSQMGSYAEFSRMNVLQQESLAKSMGMTVDKLEQAAFSQELQSKSRKELVELGGEELANRIESQTLADKFSNTMDKLKAIIVDLSTAFIPIIDGIGKALSFLAEYPSVIKLILGALAVWKSVQLGIAAATIMGSFISNPVGASIGLALGLAAVGTILAATSNASSAGDVISPASGKTQISTKEGELYNLSKNDDVVAAPGLINKLNSSQSNQVTQQIVYDNKEAKETNMLLKQILTKQGTVQMDSTKVGTVFAINTYEIQ
jgi:hypothetical protein